MRRPNLGTPTVDLGSTGYCRAPNAPRPNEEHASPCSWDGGAALTVESKRMNVTSSLVAWKKRTCRRGLPALGGRVGIVCRCCLVSPQGRVASFRRRLGFAVPQRIPKTDNIAARTSPLLKKDDFNPVPRQTSGRPLPQRGTALKPSFAIARSLLTCRLLVVMFALKVYQQHASPKGNECPH